MSLNAPFHEKSSSQAIAQQPSANVDYANSERDLASPVIVLKALHKSVTIPGQKSEQAQLEILKDIDLSISHGETLAIVGPSGSGKSTLLGIMAGLDLPSGGEVILDGERISAMDEDRRAAIRAAKVGFVFQSFQLIEALTALENVMLPIELGQELGNPREAEEKAQHILSRVGLQQRLHHYPSQLSGGEQQRVAIARAFVANPSILFADEPTGNLDKTTAAQIIDLLFEVNQEHGTTLVLVTHDSKLAQRCQAQIVLDGGQLKRS